MPTMDDIVRHEQERIRAEQERVDKRQRFVIHCIFSVAGALCLFGAIVSFYFAFVKLP